MDFYFGLFYATLLTLANAVSIGRHNLLPTAPPIVYPQVSVFDNRDLKILDRQTEANNKMNEPTSQKQKIKEDLNKHVPRPRKEGEPFVLKRTWCFWLGCANAHYYKPCCTLWQPYCTATGLDCTNPATRQKSCYNGWASVGSGCYRIVNVATFQQAKAFCEDDRGALVEITSQIEQVTLAKFYNDSLINGWVWLGANKTKDEWRWIFSGEKMIFNSWDSGEPNNADGNEDCLIWDGNKSWKAIRCDYTDTNFKAICEEHRKPMSTTDYPVSVTVAPSIKPPEPCYCGIPNRRLRIVRGKKAEKHEYPWQVALVYGNYNTPFCSGSLISRETVLTAAHCTQGLEAKDISVVIGEHDVTDNSDEQRKKKVKQIIPNNLYNFETIDYDISLIILMNPVKWSKKAKPICLPNQYTNYENVKGIVSGWGALEYSGLSSDTLLETEVMTMTNKECTTNKQYNTSQITSSMICATGYGKDACQGDSGGPLISLETGGYYSVIGVVSWGKDCADPEYPGVYSRVAHQMVWITDNMAGQTCLTPESTSSKLDSIYFIAGGRGALRDIELYHPTMANLSCSMSLPPLNNDWSYHTTFYYNNTIHLYGGHYGSASTCISYKTNTKEWKNHTLSTSRSSGHSSTILNKRVFVIGGKDISGNYAIAESTPLPLTDQPDLTPVPNLDYKGYYHCTAKIDEDTLVVTGGYGYNGHSYSYSSSVIKYNAKTRTTTSLPSMKQPRAYHGCAVVEMDNTKWIIVAGGYTGPDKYLKTTKMLQIGGSSWKPLGNLNVARSSHSIAVTQRGVMAMGGYSGGYLISVELLDWSVMSWRIVEPSLSKSRYQFGGAVEIPASMFNCQGPKPRQENIANLGYRPDCGADWYDVQGQGVKNDYCRWVGDCGCRNSNGGDCSWWSCALAGSNESLSSKGEYIEPDIIWEVKEGMGFDCWKNSGYKFEQLEPYPVDDEQHTLANCKDKCAQHSQCQAIVMKRPKIENGESTKCYMIKNINNIFNECTWGYANTHNLYKKRGL